jgi:Putative peptidoglycan binding domain
MPTFDLTRGTHGPANRRRRLLLIGALLVAGALTLTIVTGSGGSAGSNHSGPTVTAEPHDLATTLDASGTLQRSDETIVAHASALPSDGGDDPTDTPDDESDSPTAEPVSYLPDQDTPSPSSTTPTSTTPSSTTPTSTTTTTTTPCLPTSTSSTSTTSSSTTTTAPCPPTTTTTTPPSTTTPTTSPEPGAGGGSTPTDDEAPDAGGGSTPTDDEAPDDGGGSTPTDDEAPDDGGGSTPTDDEAPDDGGGSTPTGGEGDPTAPGGGDDGGDDGGGEVPSATLTSLLDVGSRVDRGTVLYTADQQPVVALIGDLPAWRTLEEGVDDGADVRQLEENLVAMGYGADLDVDETFTADTAAAVEAWETDLGRAAPDGKVTIGDVVFLTAPGDVLGHEAAVGDTLDAGSPVLTIGSEQRIVVADVDATEAGGWTPGSTVELEWADTTTTEGTVLGTGRDVADGQVELTVALGTGDTGAGARRSGAEATVTLVDARRDDAVAVPVAAIVDDGGSPAVRVAQADGPDRIIAVETGLVADGWVEITAGLDGGEEIRLPG